MQTVHMERPIHILWLEMEVMIFCRKLPGCPSISYAFLQIHPPPSVPIASTPRHQPERIAALVAALPAAAVRAR